MITSTDIGKIIQNPASASNYNPKDLEEIRNKYPYCATLHLLYLKAISLTHDLQFEDHLRFSAAHIMDREQMYYLIHSGVNEPEKIEISPSKIEVPSEKTEAQIIDISTEVPETTLPTESTKPFTTIESVKSVEEISTEGIQIEETIPAEDSSKKELLESAPDLLDMAYESDLAEESRVNISKSEEKANADKIELTETSDDNAEKAVSTKPEVSEVTVDLSNLSFVEWLKYKQNKTTATQIDAISKEVEKASEELITNKADTKAEEIKKAKKSGLSRFDVDALLNKFIKEEPSISRPQADFYNPVKNAKQSVEESPDLVTETLAKIYVLQKNYTKALQAYEQLSLVYPEKKTFFATQIKKIKEEQHKQSKQ